jgi:glutaredoxin
MTQIAVFTLNGCQMCRELKKELKRQSIDFHDIEITLNSEIWEQVLKQTHDDAVPTVFIQSDNEGNGLIYTPGRDFKDVNEILEIIKNNI